MGKIMLKDLKDTCNLEDFDFDNTEELKPFREGIIGQSRAVEAVNFGLNVEKEGYNIFMTGLPGTGKSTYAQKATEEKSKDKEVPPDLCYVFNFDTPEKPKALKLPAGIGSKLKEDMNQLVEELKEEIPAAFEGEEYEEKKKEIMSEYQQKSNKMMEEFEKEIKEEGYMLKNTPQGPVPVPLNEEGEPMEQDEYQNLSDEKKKELREKNSDINQELENIMRKVRKLKTEAQEELKNVEKKIGLSIIEPIIANMKENYDGCEEVTKYLEDVKEDIVENLNKFRNKNEDKQQKFPFPMPQNEDNGSFFKRYKINLLVNNSDTDGAPVIYETNPTYYNLFGKTEGKSQFGAITTDFTMIKSGAFHKANGGYLILQARDVLTNPLSWETLKRTLINEEVVVENIGEQYRAVPIKTLKPEAIDIDVKVIMIGNPMTYQILYYYDEEFKKLFKIKADFDVEMKKNKENLKNFASFISQISERENIKQFKKEAVCRIIEYSSRLAGEKDKLSTRFNDIIEVLYEANTWAKMAEHEYVEEEDVKKTLEKKEERSNLTEEKLREMIAKENILVDVKGKEVGQINGLSVIQTGEYSFGRPSRITARSYMGQEGVINIERKADMSGNIHNKGVLILSGYLGEKYAREKPLSLSASLAFEQNYGGIDGDSASLAELLALLSAISEYPLRQDLAITGSMNQKGMAQPIGGVNQKIEGYYKTCKVKGLTGEQGVIIPVQNKENLMLEDEVLDSVKDDEFSIYAVEDIDEAIELMFDRPAEEVHKKVNKNLEDLALKAQKFGKEDNENK
ncbi:MAG: Lon protease family protein [Bacillota bacterium]